jgi:uncharacterized membrane protein YeaQ/YmgE (transglycosylase-associated protein family)
VNVQLPIHRSDQLSFVTWIALGLIAGYVGSRLVNNPDEGKSLDLLLGAVGAVFGGWLFNTFGVPGAAEFDLHQLIAAVVGAAGLLVLYHLFFRRAT